MRPPELERRLAERRRLERPVYGDDADRAAGLFAVIVVAGLVELSAFLWWWFS